MHHILPRADSASLSPVNLLVHCSAHRQHIAPDVDGSGKVFRGLRGLGFKETDAKRALAGAYAARKIENRSALTARELLKLAFAQLAPSRSPRTPINQRAPMVPSVG